MKTNKKILRLILALTIIASMTAITFAAESIYANASSSHLGYAAITKSSSNDTVLQGFSGVTLAPTHGLSLGELAEVLSRILGYTKRTAAEVTPKESDEYVEKAISAGVIEAASRVDASVILTREQAIRYIAIAYGIAPVEGVTTFADDSNIDSKYKPYVNAFQRLGYIDPISNNNFDPKASFTSSEAVKVIDNTSLPGIVGVKTIGFMDADAAKLSAIVVEYNVDMTGANVNASTYALDVYKGRWDSNCVNLGKGNIGDITKVYVNNQPNVSATGGTGTGKYVIIEVYTDYLYSSEQKFAQSMSAGLTQKTEIKCKNVTVSPGKREISNYVLAQSHNNFPNMGGGGTEQTAQKGTITQSHDNSTGMAGNSTQQTALSGTFTIKGIEGFKYYTDNPGTYGAAGPSFKADHCFSEQDGTYHTSDLSYALYVPKDYNPKGKYALVTLENPAAMSGTHPIESVLETRGPSVFASEWAQNIVKKAHGLDGLIVVVPTVTQRVNDNGCTPAQYSALVKLWDYLQKEYSIDKNYIYGVGQSVGGMVLLETNKNRDNYFAGIMLYEDQWGQNYYKDAVFARGMTDSTYQETAQNTPRHYPSTDDYITWDYHWGDNGEKVYTNHDPNNYYYLISDDNIMLNNTSSNFLSNDVWTELNYLYSDLVGYKIPRCIVDAKATLSVQEQTVKAYFNAGNKYGKIDMGLNWVTFKDGMNGYSARKLNAGYEWLLNQTRATEMARPKLDLNKPFELAKTQDTSRVMANFIDPNNGGTIHYLTGKAGSGTQFYNTCWLRTGENVTADEIPGWLPKGMKFPVTAANIESVKAITKDGKLKAVAVKYNTEMKNAVIAIKGDKVLDSKGKPRNDDFVVMDAFDFYDTNNKQISGKITNIYINNSPKIIPNAKRGSGAGCYVIIEINTTSKSTSVGVIQRTTVRTNAAIAAASPKIYR